MISINPHVTTFLLATQEDVNVIYHFYKLLS